MNIIITGTTGMVGEGVLLECLQNERVTSMLSVSRKPCNISHPKLKELIVPDFTNLGENAASIDGYDACFYCAGISSVGMSEEKYRYITYNTTLAFAEALLKANPNITFCFVSGSHTDSAEKGKVMWARIKGKTENALRQMSFGQEYNFRPGAMLPFPAQKKAKRSYRFIVKLLRLFMPKSVLTLSEVGRAMINAVQFGHQKNVLEIKDIRLLAAQ